MLKTVEELQTLIENEPKYGGCGIDLPSGKCIGTTSGGWQPLLYQSPEDNNPTNLTWTEALALFNKEMRTVHYNKPSTTRILREGRILKANTFDTAKGCYANAASAQSSYHAAIKRLGYPIAARVFNGDMYLIKINPNKEDNHDNN